MSLGSNARRLAGAGLLVAALLPAVPTAPAAAPLGESDYQRVNEALVAGHVVPRYQALADALGGLDEAAQGYCDAPAPARLAPLRTAHDGALDAWMGVQHLQFGPVELFMRSYRLYFWPQGRGKVGQAIEALLAAADPAALEAERFRNASTAIQGLPAAEVLLFGLGSETLPSDYRCALLVRLTGNMRAMAEEILAEWRGGEIDFARTVAEPGPDNPYFATAQEASLAFFQSLYTGLEMLSDVRLKPVLGASAETARPQMVEVPRPGRSLRNIVLGLEALQGLYGGEGAGQGAGVGQGGAGSAPGLGALAVASGADPELDPLLRKAFRLTLENARGIEGPLAEAVVDAARRPALEKLQTQLTALRQILRGRLSAATGLTVGFNAMDGD
ncbi:MAG: imelysin family protein [Tistlia sp.]|uniref:imelysin family protein n=1 Tax=Tistlia sp. TaxID=3057121 RepID=UPI0034A508F9